MPVYQFMLHTTGIRFGDGEGAPAIGFYSHRRASAANVDGAREKVMAAMDSDTELRDLIQSGHDAGLKPKTEVESIHLVPWWKAMLPWTQPGLCLYANDDDEDEND